LVTNQCCHGFGGGRVTMERGGVKEPLLAGGQGLPANWAEWAPENSARLCTAGEEDKFEDTVKHVDDASSVR